MKEKEISIRGKTTIIRFTVVDKGNLTFAHVIWENGKEAYFYKDMYTKGEWFAKNIPTDLIHLLSPIFDDEKPEKLDPITNNRYVPKSR